MEGENAHPGAAQSAGALGVALSLCLLETHWLKFTGQLMGSLVGEVQFLFSASGFFFTFTAMNMYYCYNKKFWPGEDKVKTMEKPKQRSDLSPRSMRKYPEGIASLLRCVPGSDPPS